MACQPTSPESLDGLHALQRAADARGDQCLALLLAGVALYSSAGREMELLEAMRKHTDEIGDGFENTPTVGDLRRLFEL